MSSIRGKWISETQNVKVLWRIFWVVRIEIRADTHHIIFFLNGHAWIMPSKLLMKYDVKLVSPRMGKPEEKPVKCGNFSQRRYQHLPHWTQSQLSCLPMISNTFELWGIPSQILTMTLYLCQHPQNQDLCIKPSELATNMSWNVSSDCVSRKASGVRCVYSSLYFDQFISFLRPTYLCQ